MLFSRLAAVAAFAVVATALTGCRQDVDLAQVRALSQLVASAEPAYSSIADDLYDSCLREAAWNNIGNFALQVVPPKVAAAARSSEPSSPGAIALKLHGGAPPASDPFTSNAVCDPYAGSVKQWKAMSLLLTGYFEQLGAAAADDSKVDYGFATLSASIGRDAGFSSDQQTAISGFATSIATAILDARRRNLTAAEAARAQTAVDYFVKALSAVAAEYLSQLDNEQGDIDSFFKRNFVAQNVGLQTLETIPYRIAWKEAIDEINAKRRAEAAYVASLQQLADGNDGIVKAAADNDFARVYAVTTATIALLKPNVVALQKAFR